MRQELGTPEELRCGNHGAVVVRTFVEIGVGGPVGTTARCYREGDPDRLLSQAGRSPLRLRCLVDHRECSTRAVPQAHLGADLEPVELLDHWSGDHDGDMVGIGQQFAPR